MPRISGALLPILLVLALDAVPASAQPLQVPADFPTIQAAIDAATAGDEIVVAPGTYNESLDYLGKAVTVRSSDGPLVTSIDATGLITTVVSFLSGEDRDSRLEGFTIAGGESPEDGGGFTMVSTSPTIVDCVLDTNLAAGDGGGCRASGSASPLFIRCRFVGNSVLGEGGGVRASGDSEVFLINCELIGNEAVGSGGGVRASGDSVVTLVNGLLVGNFSVVDGGAVRLSGGSLALFSSCTVSENTGLAGGNVVRGSESSSAIFANCIVWENGNAAFLLSGMSSAVVSFSDVQGGFPGMGNIDAAPLFADVVGPDGVPATGDEDFSLEATSPCRDQGSDALLPLDVFDLDGDGDTGETVPVDLAGLTRVSDAAVDMGAFEIQGASVEFVRGDANGDGVVTGLVDGFFILAFQFIPGSMTPPCLDAADVDDSGGISGLVDGVAVLNFQFVPGSPPPPAPGPVACGVDPTLDALDCGTGACP